MAVHDSLSILLALGGFFMMFLEYKGEGMLSVDTGAHLRLGGGLPACRSPIPK
jgi:hypothetical protein